MSSRFISIGCLNDRDCAANMTNYEPISKAYDIIKGFPLNFQECRRLSNLGLPNLKNKNENGCLCINYLTSAQEFTDDNGYKYISCTNIDSGSIFYFILQSIIALVFLILSIRSLYIFIYFFPSLLRSVRSNLTERYGSNPIHKKGSLSLVKQHAMLCLFFLFISTSFFVFYKVSEIITYVYAIPDSSTAADKQARFSDNISAKIRFAANALFEYVGLHFTILWMNTAPNTFFDYDMNEKPYQKLLLYKRFIYLAEAIAIIPIFFLWINTTSYFGAIQIVIGVVLVYEFSWGCKLISQRFRLMAAKSDSSSHGSVLSAEKSTSSKKLSNMADRIDNLAKNFRRIGVTVIVFYIGLNIVTSLNLTISMSTLSNQRSILQEAAQASFAALFQILFNFLKESLFGFKDVSKIDQVVAVSSPNNLSIGDLSPTQLEHVKNMRSDTSAFDSSLANPLHSKGSKTAKVKMNEETIAESSD